MDSSKVRELAHWYLYHDSNNYNYDTYYKAFLDEEKYNKCYEKAIKYVDSYKKDKNWDICIQETIIKVLKKETHKAIDVQTLVQSTFDKLPLYPGTKDYLTKDSNGERYHYREEIKFELARLVRQNIVKRYDRGYYSL